MPVRSLFAALFAMVAFLLGQAQASPLEQSFDPPYCARPGDEIVATGEVRSAGVITLVLRVDDTASGSYATRVNLERAMPAGAFTWRVPLAGLLTSVGKPLDVCALSKLILFAAAGEGDVAAASLIIAPGLVRPPNVLAYDLGPQGSPVFPGFDPLTPASPLLAGHTAVPVRRPGPDALIGDGLSNLQSLHFDVAPGRWKVTLWTEDPGEWETLPHPFVRRIGVNGTVLLDQSMTAEDWVARRYLAGKAREWQAGQTAWQALGRHRGGRLSSVVTVSGHGLDISLSGDSPAAAFLAALVIEPELGRFADETDGRREQDFNEAWRILAAGDAAAEPVLPLTGANALPPVKVARRSGNSYAFRTHFGGDPNGARLRLRMPANSVLTARLWRSSPHLVRAPSGGQALQVSDRMLVAVPPQGVALSGDDRFVLWVSANADAPQGLAEIVMEIETGTGIKRVSIPVEIIDTVLPPAAKPAGFYLDEAPHLLWGSDPQDQRSRQLQCDLSVLQALGITGSAPALATPDTGHFQKFAEDADLARRNGTAFPALSYAPAKRLFSAGIDAFTVGILAADAQGRSSGSQGLIWSLADEPSNPDSAAADLLAMAPALKSLKPDIRLAGHFNHKGDEIHAEALDTILVNPGFGIDDADLAALGPDKRIWLYNTGMPRLTAGLFLHFSRAEHYVQWHARMPTADPFDPTDGREGDFQVFYPNAEACPAQLDVNEDLLDMADGLVDQRWLLWLQSRPEPQAARLLEEWRAAARQGWTSISGNPGIPGAFRRQVIQLARQLKGSP